MVNRPLLITGYCGILKNLQSLSFNYGLFIYYFFTFLMSPVYFVFEQ